MKRSISALCILISHLLFFAACGQAVPPAAPAEFSAEAQVSFGESEFTALVTQERPGALELTFTAPAELAGLRLRLQSGNATLHYGELQAELPASALPASNVAALLSGVLLRLAQSSPEGLARARGGGWTLTGHANGLPYQAVIDADGILTQISAPAAGLEVILSQP